MTLTWTVYESFDPASGTLYLDVVDSTDAPVERPGLKRAELGAFEDFREAHAFLDGYSTALRRGPEKPVREVRCGEHKHPGCDEGPCSLGVTPEYRCSYRDRKKAA